MVKELRVGSKGRVLATLGALVLMHSKLGAQCALCRTALLSSPEGKAMAAGFNQGILFLLAAPFLIVATVGALIVVARYRTSPRRISTPPAFETPGRRSGNTLARGARPSIALGDGGSEPNAGARAGP